MSLKDGFLIKRIKKVSRRKKWLAIALFWLLFFESLVQFGIIMQHRLPRVDITQPLQIEQGKNVIITIAEHSERIVTYERYPGVEHSIMFASLSNNRYIPISISTNSITPGEYIGSFSPILTEPEHPNALTPIPITPTIAPTESANLEGTLNDLVQDMEAQGATQEELDQFLGLGQLMGDIAQVQETASEEDVAVALNYEYKFSDIAQALAAQGATEPEIATLLSSGYIFICQPLPKQDIIYLILLIIAQLWLIKVWWTSRRNLKRTYTHKVFRAFVREGGELENMTQFEQEIGMRNTPGFANLVVTENWILYNGALNLKLRHLSEVVCVIQIKTQDWSFLTRWATRKKDLIIGFADKRQWRVNFGRHLHEINEFKELIKEKLPHIVCDENDKENYDLWQKRPDGILEKVGEYKFQERMARKHEDSAKAEQEGKKGRRRMRIVSDTHIPSRRDPERKEEDSKDDSTPSWGRRPTPRRGFDQDE